MREYTKILPKMDASVAEYSGSLSCTNCNKSGIDYPYLDKPKLVGWCETDYGFMIIVECPHCFQKYRFHGTSLHREKTDLYAFNHAIHLYVIANYFANCDELRNKYDTEGERDA